VLPEGACDGHTHVFGPYSRFPFVHEMPYAAPLAPAALHREMLDRVGATRGVLIQPGAFGTDPAAILDALARSGGRLRGIAATDATVADETLDRWHAAGVRGLRFNEMLAPNGADRYPGSIGVEALEPLAPRLSARGWHAELWATLDRNAALLPPLRASGVPVVLDHMAGVAGSRGLDDPAFRTVLTALREGWLWIKLTLCRASQLFPDYSDLRPFHDALIAANPDRLIWGSDWPYVRMGDRTPDVGHLLDLFQAWVPERLHGASSSTTRRVCMTSRDEPDQPLSAVGRRAERLRRGRHG
jgi:predicted TIM-barrel fold metal-dependent hydrolase